MPEEVKAVGMAQIDREQVLLLNIHQRSDFLLHDFGPGKANALRVEVHAQGGAVVATAIPSTTNASVRAATLPRADAGACRGGVRCEGCMGARSAPLSPRPIGRWALNVTRDRRVEIEPSAVQGMLQARNR